MRCDTEPMTVYKHSYNVIPFCCARMINVTTTSPKPSFDSCMSFLASAAATSPLSSVIFKYCLLDSALSNPFYLANEGFIGLILAFDRFESDQAYSEIKGRTGQMVNGVFVKSEDLIKS